ncbi:aromatic-L-amino-acid decarboxylase-like isoform X2 [Ptychodera flava]|uniref:aromatic-L-amino-acid decarboxylase-like isoform X2 n=1 Tax=Ptychodera flava TaxID=63121 RepID=UPI003969DFF6
MLSKIHKLETVAKELDPCVEKRQIWAKQVIKHSEEFMETLNTDKSKAFNKTEHNGNQLLYSLIKEEPTPMENLLELFRHNVERNGLVESHGGHMAYVNSGGLYPSSLADYLSDVVNPYSAMFHDSPGSVRIENMVLKWIAACFGYPDSFAGNLTSGGSASTVLALAAARDSRNIKARDFNKCVVYTTTLSHYCAEKALNTIGMREVVRRTIAVDSNYKMDVDILRETVKKDIEAGLIPFVVYTTAGTTDLGSVDPLETIAGISREFNIWMHVDACYGGFFILSEEATHLFKGIEKSDSFCVDPHKSLFIPYGCGAVLVKEGSKLAYSNALNRPAFYLEDSFKDECQDEPSPCNLSFELSRHFRNGWLSIGSLSRTLCGGVSFHQVSVRHGNIQQRAFRAADERWPHCLGFHPYQRRLLSKNMHTMFQNTLKRNGFTY